MIIPVTSPNGKVIEWVLVELQGKIENLTEEQATEIGVLLSKDPVRPWIISLDRCNV